MVTTSSSSSSPLLNLPQDCRLAIYAFLPDLSEIACVCRQLAQERQHIALDPTRYVTMCMDQEDATDRMNFLKRIQRMQAKYMMHQKQFPVSLRMENAVVMGRCNFGLLLHELSQVQFPAVTSLDISSAPPSTSSSSSVAVSCLSSPSKATPRMECSMFMFLAQLHPSLQSLNMSHVQANQYGLALFSRKCPQLRTLIWHGSHSNLYANGHDLQGCHALQELYMNDSVWNVKVRDDEEYILFGENNNNNSGAQQQHAQNGGRSNSNMTILQHCKSKLQRVSLKGARYVCNGDLATIRPFTQACLIQFVRQTPTLQWFESDLTLENRVRLQKEHPGVFFC